MTSNTEIKHGGREEETISSVDMGLQCLPPEPPAELLKKHTVPPTVTLSSLLSFAYIAPVWGGKRETNHAKSVQESLFTARMPTMGMRDVGVRFQGGLLTQIIKTNERKSVHCPNCTRLILYHNEFDYKCLGCCCPTLY